MGAILTIDGAVGGSMPRGTFTGTEGAFRLWLAVGEG